MQKFEKHLTIDSSNQTTIDCLSFALPNVSKQKIKLAMKYGCVWLTRQNEKTTRVRKAKKILEMEDQLSIYFDETILFSDITPASLISDNGVYSVWNKPSGMFSQGTKWGDHTSITRWIEIFGLKRYKMQESPIFLVHRLDRATSGLILVAHSKKTAATLAKLFESRQIEKCYQATVRGEFPKKLLLSDIVKPIDGRKAISRVLSSKYHHSENQSDLLIQIETGRKHQIRRHLASIGFPIIGDRLYGNNGDGNSIDENEDSKNQNDNSPDGENQITSEQPDLMLQSSKLSFICPITNKKRTFVIE